MRRPLAVLRSKRKRPSLLNFRPLGVRSHQSHIKVGVLPMVGPQPIAVNSPCAATPSHAALSPRLPSHALEVPNAPTLSGLAMALLGLLQRRGRAAFAWRALAEATRAPTSARSAPLSPFDEAVAPVSVPGLWAALETGVVMSYRLRYCRLNRKVRKNLKNRYKYSKRPERIWPHARHQYGYRLMLYTLHYHENRRFAQRLASLFAVIQKNPSTSPWFVLGIQQAQSVLSTFVQQYTARHKT